jgi:hypothetical protein
MDSSVSETYGHQQGSAYNGHFGCTCYHPLFVFNQFGDLERVMLRRGNHHSAKFWRRVLLPGSPAIATSKSPSWGSGSNRAKTYGSVFCAMRSPGCAPAGLARHSARGPRPVIPGLRGMRYSPQC